MVEFQYNLSYYNNQFYLMTVEKHWSPLEIWKKKLMDLEKQVSKPIYLRYWNWTVRKVITNAIVFKFIVDISSFKRQ